VAGIGGHWVLGKRRFDGYMVLDQTEHYSRVVWRQIMSHEVGHILGLGHARSRSQLMYGTSTMLNRLWGNGDLTALRRIGASQGCLHTKRTERPLSGTEAVTVSDS
jgi:predicted Zn-dependent protease